MEIRNFILSTMAKLNGLPKYPLVGKALLSKIKGFDGSRQDMAKSCGYYSVTKKHGVRANLNQFDDALLSAKSLDRFHGVEGNGEQEKSENAIAALGWTEEEARETYYRLKMFEEDWNAPGMEAYDRL